MRLVLLLIPILFTIDNGGSKKSEVQNEPDFSLFYFKKNQISENPLTLSEILSFARKASENQTSSIYKNYRQFDFNQFKPLIEDDKSGSYTVYYNEQGKITKIIKYSANENNSFEFNVNENKKFRILTIQQFDGKTKDKGKKWIHGFFLNYKGKMYFFGENRFDHSTFYQESKQLSCIMLLDKDLKALTNLQLQFNEILYKSKVVYKNSKDLFSEIIYKSNLKRQVTDSSTLEEIVRDMYSKKLFSVEGRESRIGVADQYAYYPLWIFGGNHDHYPDKY